MKFLMSVLIGLLFLSCNKQPEAVAKDSPIKNHADLVTFFNEWREFWTPEMIDGIPDYSKAAMSKQQQELKDWQRRLNAIDTAGWSVSDRIDWTLIWAEMNGTDFEHRVTRPWERDPAFYIWFHPGPTDVPEREGPNIFADIEVAYYDKPYSAEDAQEIADRLRKTDQLYQQARTNLTGNARDLWVTGVLSIRSQSNNLNSFAESVAESHPDLAKAANEAKDASDRFADWLDSQSASKTGTSGVGKENYDWYLTHVGLRPFTWKEEVDLIKRELGRSHMSLRLEENRNRNLPKLKHMSSAEEYDRRMNKGLKDYMKFLEDEEIFTIKPYTEQAYRERLGKFTKADGLRGFFHEIIYRGPIIMRTHDTHWVELAQIREEPHPNPIRRGALLHNIFDGRAEGLATGMEEMMMHAGYLEGEPRMRELIWILLAMRAARALGGLYQHGLEMDFEEATKISDKWVPWGLLPAEGATIRWEQQFYLRQPGYGESYVSGKFEMERLMAEYARQRPDTFVLKKFMDELFSVGVIPVSMVHWQMTGENILQKYLNGETL